VTSDGFHTYTYDAEGNLTAVDGGSTATYMYNALNERVSETVGGTTTQFAYNVAGQRVSIWNTASPAGQLVEQYYVGNKRVAYFANNMLHFQHQDWTGTERMRTTFNGAVEGTFTSMSFGDAFATVSGTDGDPYHYAMQDHDYSSDTDHAQFRQYSSTPGRWMSPDPYSGSYHMRNPQSFNRYTYALNNPMRFVDPKGLDEQVPNDPGNETDDGGGCDYACEPMGDGNSYDDGSGEDPADPGTADPGTGDSITAGMVLSTPCSADSTDPSCGSSTTVVGCPAGNTDILCNQMNISTSTSCADLPGECASIGNEQNDNQDQLTSLFESQETIEQLASTAMVPMMMVSTAGIITEGGAEAIVGACGGDGPFALVTCLPVVSVVGPSVAGADYILLKNAYTITVGVTIPTWENIF
jgi:RHS repeat-associated protein